MATSKRLGYGGSASIGGTQLLITGGSFDYARTVSYLNMIRTPPSATMAGRVQHADGIKDYTGSLSFDVHDGAMALFGTTALLGRYYEFTVGINDGVNDWKMEKCKATSVTVSGAVGGVVSAQVSFLAKTAKVAGGTPNAFIRDTAIPLGYWYTGGGSSDNIRDWSLTMAQEAQLVYRNEDSMDPGYIKVGLVSYVLSVTSYNSITAPASINIGTSSFTLTGNTTGSGFSYGGITDVGSYSYTFETSSSTGKSNAVVIT